MSSVSVVCMWALYRCVRCTSDYVCARPTKEQHSFHSEPPSSFFARLSPIQTMHQEVLATPQFQRLLIGHLLDDRREGLCFSSLVLGEHARYSYIIYGDIGSSPMYYFDWP
ncbi:hypothetical protein DPMN_020244 [Dreissena polymorpha]|uniref:Secreted protein n=1 Tax=Dreissena polymorpha TaxID=45954 RepID=A0A9D4S8W5_DREPO|nr:hypothetical protein DPMN_020244 [Dreissena polymorpha]